MEDIQTIMELQLKVLQQKHQIETLTNQIRALQALLNQSKEEAKPTKPSVGRPPKAPK